MLEALIFDVDGTLADTERHGHRVAYNAAFQAAGLGWRWSEAEYGRLLAITGGKERMRYYINAFRPDHRSRSDMETVIDSLFQDKTRRFVRLIESGNIPLRPGIERLLHEAREAGLRLAIATTTALANVTSLVRHNLGDEALDWFELIAAGDIVPAKKPAPDIYQYVLRELGLEPQQVLAFEDSRNGLLSASGAGVRTIITVTDYTRDEDFSGAAIVLDQLGDPGSHARVLAGPSLNGAGIVNVRFLRELHTG